MRGSCRLAALVLLLTFGVAIGVAAEQATPKTEKSDARVKRLLDGVGLKYEVDADGDFKLVNPLDGGRSHAVFINSNTTKLGKLELREVWALAAMSSLPPSRERALELLAENDRVKLGAWRLKKVRGRYLLVFAAQVPADANKVTLLLTLQAVSATADAMERKLTASKDEY